MDIVIVTGASGFLGRHIIRLLDEDERTKEIRGVDLKPFPEDINISTPYHHYLCDIQHPQRTEMMAAFHGANCVIHCAAFIAYGGNSSYEHFEKNNVTGTEHILNLCKEYNIDRFIFTSTAEVTWLSYFKRGTFSLIVNQTESSSALNDRDINDLIIPFYPRSKLMAEIRVLGNNGGHLKSGKVLRTTALRPTLLYGEGDRWLIPSLLKLASRNRGSFPRLSYLDGLLQMTYVGNAAWAHICAKNVLRDDPSAISGLPILITDETRIEEPLKFIEKLSYCKNLQKSRCQSTKWGCPYVFSYFIGILLELIAKYVYSRLANRWSVSPRILVSIMASVICYNTLRSKIHLNYKPIFSREESFERAHAYYSVANSL